MSAFKRNVLTDSRQEYTAAIRQANLVTLIDLTLDLKRADWNVVGPNFCRLHLQLKEVSEDLMVGTSSQLAKHRWVVQAPAVEKSADSAHRRSS